MKNRKKEIKRERERVKERKNTQIEPDQASQEVQTLAYFFIILESERTCGMASFSMEFMIILNIHSKYQVGSADKHETLSPSSLKEPLDTADKNCISLHCFKN